MSEVRFDDLPALQALVGEALDAPGEPIAITQEMIDRFAALTGDSQWIHVDPERAQREGPFGGTVAHGLLLLSLVPALCRGGVRIVGFASAINYGFDEVRFLAPVPAGSEVRARRRIVHVRKKGPRGSQITFEVEIGVSGAERPAMTCRWVVVFLGAA